jgi:ferredoxin
VGKRKRKWDDWRDKKPPEDDLEALKRKVRALETRLQHLRARIGEIEQGYTALRSIAIVNAEKCAGCGICQDICPTGAVSLEEVARIDSKRCTGCGRCVEACPQGALSMRTVEPHFQEQTKRAM